jgi:hypothetical protein
MSTTSSTVNSNPIEYSPTTVITSRLIDLDGMAKGVDSDFHARSGNHASVCLPGLLPRSSAKASIPARGYASADDEVRNVKFVQQNRMISWSVANHSIHESNNVKKAIEHFGPSHDVQTSVEIPVSSSTVDSTWRDERETCISTNLYSDGFPRHRTQCETHDGTRDSSPHHHKFESNGVSNANQSNMTSTLALHTPLSHPMISSSACRYGLQSGSQRTCSRAIAIKRNPVREVLDEDSVNDRTYDWATWRMYNRIVDHRMKHPIKAYITAPMNDVGAAVDVDDSHFKGLRNNSTETCLPGITDFLDPENYMDEEIFDLDI